MNGTAIHVKWKPPQSPNGPLKYYTVYYDETQNFATGIYVRMVSVMPNITAVFIGGLDPFTNYTIKVKVQNSITGMESEAVTIMTKSAGMVNKAPSDF